ncbi:hypothetical protein CRI94_15100 [Longibacter salinarum]|uniref:Uncharacterized protein n=1 Tax=Longibacter salinarum TaxID=1850348 RepID=A0A2A8CVS0_9BACT|nr:hypothetical protein CRI94_15100 [Longibacter salinarum]
MALSLLLGEKTLIRYNDACGELFCPEHAKTLSNQHDNLRTGAQKASQRPHLNRKSAGLDV